MRKQYVITLTDAERATLTGMTRTGTQRVYRLRRAQMLLLAARGRTDAQIAAQVEVHPRTVARLRERAATHGVLAALEDRPRPGVARKLDDLAEAVLVATACATPPDGQARWLTYALADRLVALDIVDSISAQTVRRALKKQTQAVVEKAVVYSSGGCALCLQDGRCPDGLCRTIRSAASGGVY